MGTLGWLANLAQVISLLVAVVAVVVSIWLYLRGKQRRAISCIFDPIVAPIEIRSGEALKGDLEIRYRGQPVDNIFLVRARLRSTGNLPIRRSHVIEPVTFTFGPEVTILREPRAIYQKPENLKIGWSLSYADSASRSNAVSLDFDLLNPKEELTVEFTCTGHSEIPKVTARIEGVREIGLLDPEESQLRRGILDNLMALVVFAGVGSIMYGLTLMSAIPSREMLTVVAGTVVLSGAAFCVPSLLTKTVRLILYRWRRTRDKS